MLSLQELARRANPTRTILFLGAGSSIPSGAPSGPAFAEHLVASLSPNRPISGTFTEVCSLLEYRCTRAELVREVRVRLKDLSPTGGLLVIPGYAWSAIYTTNYDLLVECVRDPAYLQPALDSVAKGFDQLRDPEITARLRRMQSELPHLRRIASSSAAARS